MNKQRPKGNLFPLLLLGIALITMLNHLALHTQKNQLNEFSHSSKIDEPKEYTASVDIPVSNGGCDDKVCAANGGNCKYNVCEPDSGANLRLKRFIIPKALSKYTWETNGIANSDLESLNSNEIPKLIHRSWKTSHVPSAYNKLLQNCKQTHPDWLSIVWSDEDNLELIRREYPQYLYMYQRMQLNIERADFSRLLYMYHYGGLYVDLDVDCIKNSDELIKDKIIVLGKMGEDFPHNIPNAIMYSRKKHNFWLFVINLVTIRMRDNTGAEATTGPVVLKDAYELYKTYSKDIYVTEPGTLYGVDWRERNSKYPECLSDKNGVKDIEKCRSYFPNAYLITYWQHSWNDQFTTEHPE